MAQKQVAARIEGDVYQGMFFWLQAASLLRPESKVGRVAIEYDRATGVDDVAVHFTAPGVDAGGRSCEADYFQVKYHVDRREQYGASSLCDPGFIGANRSLLQRFHDAHQELRKQGGWYRLNLVSNWQWAMNDPVGPLLRESQSGALPDRFFSDGPKSALGKVRRAWNDHLGLSAQDFEDFARRLHLGVNYIGRPFLRELLNERLLNVGLLGLAADKMQNVYDSITQQLILNGKNEFTPQTFRDLCEREGLLAPVTPAGPPVVGIRSFMRFAERMEDECQRFVCVAEHFDGRHVRDLSLWQTSLKSAVQSFLAAPRLRAQEHHLLLDCHSSLALFAGYELDRKSGAQVFPVQKGVRSAVWKPSGATPTSSVEWFESTTTIADGGSDVALAVSVTHDVLKDVRAFVQTSRSAASLVEVRPASGIGPRSVVDADHAVGLADSLAAIIRKHRPADGGTLHLFTAAPNALLYFLGQHRGALGKVQLYEFDFEGEQGGTYSPSIRLPT